jgi:hypothetical protein
MDDLSFQNYCIVCDHLIEAPQDPEPAACLPSVAKQGRKKAQGTIRVGFFNMKTKHHAISRVDTVV